MSNTDEMIRRYEEQLARFEERLTRMESGMKPLQNKEQLRGSGSAIGLRLGVDVCLLYTSPSPRD